MKHLTAKQLEALFHQKVKERLPDPYNVPVGNIDGIIKEAASEIGLPAAVVKCHIRCTYPDLKCVLDCSVEIPI